MRFHATPAPTASSVKDRQLPQLSDNNAELLQRPSLFKTSPSHEDSPGVLKTCDVDQIRDLIIYGHLYGASCQSEDGVMISDRFENRVCRITSPEQTGVVDLSPCVQEASPLAPGRAIDPLQHDSDSQPFKPSLSSKTQLVAKRRTGKKRVRLGRLDKSPSVGRPLSEIARDVPHNIVTDAASFASRSVAERRREAAEAGKVKRPLNAFMLYRKAYQNVAKTQCSRNNHQQVSTVCGDSWKMWEPPAVCERFKQFAEIEKQKHGEAFPKYKYIPVQTKKSRVDTSSLLSTTEEAEAGARYSLVRYGCHPDRKACGPEAGSKAPPWYRYMNHRTTHMSLPATLEATCFNQAVSGDSTEIHEEGCIDPSLLPRVSENTFTNFPLQSYSTYDSEWQNFLTGQQEDSWMIPGLDLTGAHNAYLKGTIEDWKIEPFDETSEFDEVILYNN